MHQIPRRPEITRMVKVPTSRVLWTNWRYKLDGHQGQPSPEVRERAKGIILRAVTRGWRRGWYPSDQDLLRRCTYHRKPRAATEVAIRQAIQDLVRTGRIEEWSTEEVVRRDKLGPPEQYLDDAGRLLWHRPVIRGALVEKGINRRRYTPTAAYIASMKPRPPVDGHADPSKPLAAAATRLRKTSRKQTSTKSTR